MNTKVKICGITFLKDALDIAKLGVDYLGFVINYPQSPRSLGVEQVCAIINKVKKINSNIKFVGVFVNEDLERIEKIVKKCGLDIVQLHGGENPKYCESLQKITKVWKAFVVKEKLDVENAKLYRNVVDKILFDAGMGGGKQINYELLVEEEVDILAGGLGLDNIKEAINKLHPEIVDLNSRLESSSGKKDIDLVRQVLEQVKNTRI